MKAFIILISIFFIGQKGISQDWISVGADNEGDKWYVKSTYVSKNGFGNSQDNIKIWTKQELKKITIKKNGKTLTYTNAKKLQLVVADCSEQKVKFITTTVYNSQGKIIDNYTIADYEQEWKDIVPDSIGESMLNKICELFN